MKLIPRNWDKFQQYKDRKPTWIKFHRDLLNDFSYSSVQIGTKATLPLLWLLACEYDDGIIDATVEEISFRIHIDADTVIKAIDELLERGFFTLVSKCKEAYKKLPREEKRREEKEIDELPLSELEDATEIAEYLYNKIITINPKTRSNYKSWVKDIDKAMRIDKRTKDELIRCIDWMYTEKGAFWQTVVQSGVKLRSKFDTMFTQAVVSKGKQSKSNNSRLSGLDQRFLNG